MKVVMVLIGVLRLRAFSFAKATADAKAPRYGERFCS